MNESPSTSGAPRLPTITRFTSWLFSRSLLGCALVGLAALTTLIALVATEETWRGKRAWERYKHELEAQGEKLDWKDYIPPPVPDAQNFAMTPFLAPLFDFYPEPRQEGQSRWRDTNGFSRANSLGLKYPPLLTAEYRPDRSWRQMTDLPAWAAALTNNAVAAAAENAAQEAFLRRYGVRRPSGAPEPTSAVAEPTVPVLALTRGEAATEVLRALAKYNPILEELRRASQRPYVRFNVHYDDEFAPAILLPQLAVMKNAAILFQLRACAELELGQSDQAWSDTRMALYLADTVKDEPFLISKLVQVAIDQLALQPIWEGLAEHKWSDAQLTEIEQRLGKLDLLVDSALRGERALGIRRIEQTRSLGIINPETSGRLPRVLTLLLRGAFYQNELSLTRMYQQLYVPVVDAATQRIYPSRATANEAALTSALAHGFRPYNLFARMLLPAITRAETKFAFGQTRVNLAIVACALERFRVAQGQFPESLEPLSPRFLSKSPHDIITGAPLIYRRTQDGQFILYSVGWNEKDDGGTVVMTQAKQPSADITQGDWIWQYSAPAVSHVHSAARQ